MALLKIIRHVKHIKTQVVSQPSIPHYSILSLRSSLHQSSRMARWEMLPKTPFPLPEGGLTFPATFSIRDSGHCPPAEHPPPAPRERGKSQPGEDREPPRFPVPAPAPPVPQRSTAPGRILPRPIQGRKIPAGFPDTRPRDCLRSGSAGQHLLMNSNISDNPTETLK